MSAAEGQKIAMRGAGYYSANTVGAKYVIDKVGDLVVKAVAGCPDWPMASHSPSPISAPPTAAPRWT